MRSLIVIHFFLFLFAFTMAQHNDAEISHLENSLHAGQRTIQDILTDTALVRFHRDTRFRELIKKYSKVSELTYITSSEPGRRIFITGTVKNETGGALSDVLVYFYQTDSRGWYAADGPHIAGMEGDRRHARLFGYVRTDGNGQFILHTIQPHGYPQSELPAHIHVEIFEPGFENLITEFLFEDDPRLTPAIKARSLRENLLLAKSEGNNYRYTIILRKK